VSGRGIRIGTIDIIDTGGPVFSRIACLIGRQLSAEFVVAKHRPTANERAGNISSNWRFVLASPRRQPCGSNRDRHPRHVGRRDTHSTNSPGYRISTGVVKIESLRISV
jgi:hypothetical protein